MEWCGSGVLDDRADFQDDFLQRRGGKVAQLADESLLVDSAQLEDIDSRYFGEAINRIRIDSDMPEVAGEMMLPFSERSNELD